MLEFSEVQFLFQIVISRKSVGIIATRQPKVTERFVFTTQSSLNFGRFFVVTNEFLSQMKLHTERNYTVR